MLTSYFNNPTAFWLLACLPLLALLAAYSWWRGHRIGARLAGALSLRSLIAVSLWRRLLSAFCFCAGIIFLIIALAGPQWGYEWNYQRALGRDLVIVLDLSRSMLAEAEPSRQTRAKQFVRDLTYWAEERGGYRLGLVVFAGRAKVACPLTSDYRHVRHVLNQYDAALLPPELRPLSSTAVSGTRIGAALQLALGLHKESLVGGMDILLLSDGDDPVQDREWLTGVLAAKQYDVPVDVIGLGDPEQARWIPGESGFLEYDGARVQTRLHEELLMEIAKRTGGIYLPMRTSSEATVLQQYEQLLRARQHMDVSSNDQLPLRKPRQVWFLVPALMFIIVSLTLGQSRAPRGGVS